MTEPTSAASESPQQLPRLSVIVPCFNNEGTIATQLEALARQGYPGWWEVIVADNGSTDGTRDVVERFRSRLPGLRVVDASNAPGAGHARNVGASHASGDHFVFVDGDDEVCDGWLGAIAAGLSRHELVASTFDTARLNPAWLQAVRQPAVPGERLPFPPYFEHAGGSGLAARRALFEKIGGFASAWCQDTDFCVRAQLAGAQLHFADGAVVHCRYRTDWLGSYRQGRRWGEGGARLFALYADGDSDRLTLWLRWPLRHWATIARSAARCRDRGERIRLAFLLGRQAGRIRGSIRYRVPSF